MSKPTETIVRIGTTVGKHTEAWGSAWVARRSVAGGVTKGCRRGTETCGDTERGSRGAWGGG